LKSINSTRYPGILFKDHKPATAAASSTKHDVHMYEVIYNWCIALQLRCSTKQYGCRLPVLTATALPLRHTSGELQDLCAAT
jgi:hypothetical protein